MVLSDRSIREAIRAGQIGIDPFDETCVQPSSVDLHVDRYFRLFRNHSSRVIDVREDQEDLTELVDVGDDPLILHPGRVRARLDHREGVPCPTTWSPGWRASPPSVGSGLLIHSTAGFVDAGWAGHLTLELSNVANLPITVYPGMKIGQISFLADDHAGRPPLRIGQPALEVPGPVGPHPEPLRREFPPLIRDVGTSGARPVPGPPPRSCYSLVTNHQEESQQCRSDSP